jgi:regulatory protein SWI6
MDVNGVAVMRRRNDSWLNATQILKVAGVEKGKRTKILEKEIQTGEHEKVQGGYGKYQGTWIQFERGVEVCRQYGVEEVLHPLLTYDMGQDGGVAGRGDIITPTKEQAMAAQRKRMYMANAERQGNAAMSTTFFKGISTTASQMVAAISKARFDSPAPKNRNGPTRPPSFSRQASMSQQVDDFPGASQQSHMSEYAANAETPFSTQQTAGAMDVDQPPRKRQRLAMTPNDSFNFNGSNMDLYATAFPGSPTEPNESFIYSQAALQEQAIDHFGPLAPLPLEASPEAETRKQKLLSLFLETPSPDQDRHDIIRCMTPRDLDTPIDIHCHTVLHWAAALCRMDLLRELIKAGANPFRVNASGHTALMRACMVTNASEIAAFPDILDSLGDTLEVRDQKGRTVLHHIAITSAVKGRNGASRYYLESILEWIVRQGSNSTPSSQEKPNGAPQQQSSSQSLAPKMGLVRFINEVVNVQDSSGDTALNIAAKNGNRSVISQLLEVGADNKIANKSGLSPADFGVGVGHSENGQSKGQQAGQNGNGQMVNSQRSREGADSIMGCELMRFWWIRVVANLGLVISHLLNEKTGDVQRDLKQKQDDVDALHNQIRRTTGDLTETRKRIEHLKETVRKQQLARQQVVNLTHAREDEQSRFDPAGQRARADRVASWETELRAALETAYGSNPNESSSQILLPSTNLLKARIKALEGTTGMTRKMVGALKGRSRDIEMKYRKVVSLCTQVPETHIDSMVEGLLRAVESEKGELEIGRVRRFLGGVELEGH